MTRLLSSVALLVTLSSFAVKAQAEPPAKEESSVLQYVVYVSRHGVRSPTGKTAQYNQYSSSDWPEWQVEPGYLTPHGFRLMELFGTYDRAQLSNQGLFKSTGCEDAAKVTIYADSDQRTLETGKALAQGLMPSCALTVQGMAEGTNDPLFHPVPSLLTKFDPAVSRAAIAGRLGGDPANIAIAYHDELAVLDRILQGCGTAPVTRAKRLSLFDIPATLTSGTGDHLADLKGPINTASTLSENLLLEYTEGMEGNSMGWGCVHHEDIQRVMTLHTIATDFAQRTPEIARAQASNLLAHIRLSMQQATSGKPVRGAIGKPGDKALILVGHDTNLENMSGALALTWIVDGRRDDTPPGGALVFELWKKTSNGEYSVRTYYTAQTLEQMRTATPLTLTSPPARVPVFLPGCSRADLSCALPDYLQLLERASDARAILPF